MRDWVGTVQRIALLFEDCVLQVCRSRKVPTNSRLSLQLFDADKLESGCVVSVKLHVQPQVQVLTANFQHGHGIRKCLNGSEIRCNRQSCSMSTQPACLFESVMKFLFRNEVSFLPILLLRGVPVVMG